eukprot:gene37838-26797_t
MSARVEPAKSGRSTCVASNERIEKGELRFGFYRKGADIPAQTSPYLCMDQVGYGYHLWHRLHHITPQQARNVQSLLGGVTGVDGYADLNKEQQRQ